MTREQFLPTVVLVLVLVSAGCLGLTGRHTPTATPSQTPKTTEQATQTMPSTTAETTARPEQTPTPTPSADTNGSNSSDADTNGSVGSNESKYLTEMRHILRSDSLEMSSLNTPLPANNTLNAGIVEIKSITTEEYAAGTANDTRLRVEYYNTNDEGDGLNEIRVISLAYGHIINRSRINDDSISFDEVDVYVYQNHSSSHPTGQLKIDESWMLFYTTHVWGGETTFGTTMATSSPLQNGIFNR